MSVEYLEITDPLYIPECVAIQKDIFHLSDTDMYPASFFSLLLRNEHPLGMLVGCFKTEDNNRKLIGLTTLITDKEPNSLYCLFVGVIPEYQHTKYAYNLTVSVKDYALNKGFTTIYGIYDPLESNLAKLYTHLGVTIHKYIKSPYKLDNEEVIEVDKVLFKWKINSDWVTNKITRQKTTTFNEVIEQHPVIDKLDSNLDRFLIEIPIKYQQLVETNKIEASLWRTKTKELFDEYLNKKNYSIIDCVSGRLNEEKKVFYLFKKSTNES